MQQQPGAVTLDTLGGGALAELFNAELARVLANIADVNTDETARRSISIVVTFKPNADRDNAQIGIACSSKLAGIQKVQSQVLIGRRNGQLIAVEHNPTQQGLFDQPRTPTGPVAFPAPAVAAGGEQ